MRTQNKARERTIKSSLSPKSLRPDFYLSEPEAESQNRWGDKLAEKCEWKETRVRMFGNLPNFFSRLWPFESTKTKSSIGMPGLLELPCAFVIP